MNCDCTTLQFTEDVTEVAKLVEQHFTSPINRWHNNRNAKLLQ